MPTRTLLLVCALLRCWVASDFAFAEEKKLERFFLSNSTITESRAPLYMAQALGLFEKYGLDVRIVNIRGAAVNVASLMAGEIQMALAAGTVAVTAAARGAPIVIVATIGPSNYSLVAGTSIASALQLKGKTIGIGGFGSGDYFVLRRLLAKLELVPEKDVSILPMGITSPYDRINVMLAGKVDAVMAIPSSIARIEARGVKVNVLAASEEQGIEASGGDFFTTREFLKSRPHQVKAMFKAFSDAIKMGRENKDLFNRVMRNTMKEENPKVLEALYRSHYFLGNKPHNAHPLEKALDFDIKDLRVTIPELNGRKAADFIDATLLREVEKEGFFSWVKP